MFLYNIAKAFNTFTFVAHLSVNALSVNVFSINVVSMNVFALKL